jgi:hypothetical protein
MPRTCPRASPGAAAGSRKAARWVRITQRGRCPPRRHQCCSAGGLKPSRPTRTEQGGQAPGRYRPPRGRGRRDLGHVLGLLFGVLFFVPFLGMAVGAGMGALLGRGPRTRSTRSSRTRAGRCSSRAPPLFMVVEKVTRTRRWRRCPSTAAPSSRAGCRMRPSSSSSRRRCTARAPARNQPSPGKTVGGCRQGAVSSPYAGFARTSWTSRVEQAGLPAQPGTSSKKNA